MIEGALFFVLVVAGVLVVRSSRRAQRAREREQDLFQARLRALRKQEQTRW